MLNLLAKLNEPVQIPPIVTRWLKAVPLAQPYYLIVGAVVGAITALFGAIFFVILLIVLNFNPLGWME